MKVTWQTTVISNVPQLRMEEVIIIAATIDIDSTRTCTGEGDEQSRRQRVGWISQNVKTFWKIIHHAADDTEVIGNIVVGAT